MRPKLLAVVVVAVAALLAPATASAVTDYGPGTRNILSNSQSGAVPPDKNSTDQLKLYDALTPLFDKVGASDLTRYFKTEQFGLRGKAKRSESTGRKGLKIVRDSFDVPHINGKTRSDVEFGAGWVTAEDRGLFIETIRGPARIAALDVPGLNAFTLATSLRQFTPSSAAEARVRQVERIAKRTAKGRRLLKDVDAFVAGINAYYKKTNNKAKRWTRTDVEAAAALIGAVFGKGGGDEVRRSQFLSALQGRLGQSGGLNVWRDLRSANDPEHPTTLSRSFPYEQTPTGPTPGSLVVDNGSISASASKAAAASQAEKQHMSNALLVSRKRSANGHPIAVMGPQIGYFYPGFFMEMDLHGGGIDARGGAFPGVSLYVLVGRGEDFAWSATSSGSDNIDQFLEQLCNSDGSPPTRASTSYLYKGKCRAMPSFNAGVLGPGGGQPARTLRYFETVHGPVSGTVTVDGKPYAVSLDRSSRGRDVLAANAFADLNTNKVRSAKDFVGAMNQMPFTFNFLYADDRDIAFFSSGRLPIRAPGTDGGLPTLGTGKYDWQGFLPHSKHPQGINPDLIVNWNNKPAASFGSADDEWGSRSSVHRVQLFNGFPKRATPQAVASIMNRAATQDLRAEHVWPIIADVLKTGPAPDAQSQQAADLVTAWSKNGSSRLDRNLDGKIDDPGAAVLDQSWQRLAKMVLEPVLGPLADDGPGTLTEFQSRDGEPNDQGNAYGDGWSGYVSKDLRSLLGQKVKGAYSRRYCGNGNLAACRDSLWAVLKAASDELAAAQGPNPGAWRADATAERIVFRPGLLGPSNTMRWTNRPTFQQVVNFTRHRPRR